MLLAVLVSLLRGALWLDERESNTTTLGALALTIAFVAPFVLVLFSVRLRPLEQRRAFWLAGAGIALILAALTIFSGIGWLYLIVAGFLGRAWWGTRRRDIGARNPLAPLLMGWIVLSLGGSLWLLWLRDTPRCWDGRAWSSSEASIPQTQDCSSDIIDTLEGVYSLGLVALCVIGTAAILRLWHTEYSDQSRFDQAGAHFNPLSLDER